MTTRVMYDSVDPSQIPSDATAVAGYVNGHWPTFSQLTRFHANRLSIAVNASADAACLDVETGDATPAQAPEWVRRQIARGEKRPVVYANRSTMPAVLEELHRAGIQRSAVRLWTAHYGFLHLCSSQACGAGFEADATQWTQTALGRNLDESILNATFFPEPPKRHKTLPKIKVKRPQKPHPKVTAASLTSLIAAAVTTVAHSLGLRIDPAEASGIAVAAATIGGYFYPARRAKP